MVSKTSHRKSTSGVPRACHAGHCRLCFFIVIPGLRPGNPNQTNFLLVIAGLDPAIQVNHKANLFIWILGSSPRMTVLLYLSQKMLEQRGLRGTIPTTDRSGRCLWILGSSPRMTILQSTISHPALLTALCEWLRFWSKN